MLKNRLLLRIAALLALSFAAAAVADDDPRKTAGARPDSIEVKGEPEQPGVTGSVAATGLGRGEVERLSDGVVSDPMRALQSLPSAVGNDEFSGRFGFRGASASGVGLYLDGILLHNAFHYARDGAYPVSLTIFPTSFIETATAFPGNQPLEFAGAGAAAVAFTSREEPAGGHAFGVAISPMEAIATAEGSFTGGSWLVGLRHNLSGYIVRRLGVDSPVAFNADDGHFKAWFHPDPFDTLSATWITGISGLSASDSQPGGGDSTGSYRTSIARLGWRRVTRQWLVTTQGAVLEDRQFDSAGAGRPSADQSYRETLWRTDGVWAPSPSEFSGFGVSFRRMRARIGETMTVPGGDRTQLAADGYISQSIALKGLRMRLGLKAERRSGAPLTWSPDISIAAQVCSRVRVQAAWSDLAQFAAVEEVIQRPLSLQRPQRSRQSSAGLQGALLRGFEVKAEFWHRSERNPLTDPAPFTFFAPPGLTRGFAYGLDTAVHLQFGRLESRISYGWLRSRQFGGEWFRADADQRNTLKSTFSYRFSDSLLAMITVRYGSGLPIPGAFRYTPAGLVVGGERNRLNGDDYGRLDLALRKAYQLSRVKVVAHFEVVNATNRRNTRFAGVESYDASSGLVRLSVERMLPLLPTAGLAFQF